MSIRRRLERLESSRQASAEEITGLFIICSDDDPAPAPGAVLLATTGAVETWRLPNGNIERVKQI